MKHPPLIFLAMLLIMAIGWTSLVATPQRQFGNQESELQDGQLYPVARSGLANQGREVYRSQGCYYCHSQAAQGNAADLPQFGKRRSVAADFLFESPAMVGAIRVGPDLANIGERQKSDEWHLLHLYKPQLVVTGSLMPSYPFLFEKRKISGGVPSAQALNLPPSAGLEKGFEIIPLQEARALVEYLKSLRTDISLLEAPIATPTTNNPAAGKVNGKATEK